MVDIEFGTYGEESRVRSCLGEDICQLIRGRHMMDLYLLLKNFFSDKIKINFDVLSPSMKNGISREVHCVEVVTLDDQSCGGRYV